MAENANNQNLCGVPDPEVVFKKDDLANLDACEIPNETLAGPTDAELQKEIEAFISESDAILKNTPDELSSLESCVGAITSAIDEMGNITKLNTKKNLTLSKLIEIRDNLYPIYFYHQSRYDLLDVKKYSTSQLEDLKKGLQINKFAKVYAKLKNISMTIPGIGQLIGGNTVMKDMANYTSAVDIKDNLPNTDILTMTLKNNLINVDININEPKPFEDKTTWKDYIKNKNILKGAPFSAFTINLISSDKKNGGILYTNYYNKLEDVMDNFFTKEERGLSIDIQRVDAKLLENSKAASSVLGDASAMKDSAYSVTENGKKSFIEDSLKYQEFYKNAATNIINRLEVVKPSKIENQNTDLYFQLPMPVRVISNSVINAMNMAKSSFYTLAQAEMGYYFNSYSSLSDRMGIARTTSLIFINWWNGLNKEINTLKKEIDTSIVSSKEDMLKYLKEKSPCLKDATLEEEVQEQVTDIDKSFNNPDITKPRMDKQCYWKKFAKDATTVGLLPYPDLEYQGAGTFSFRYWPIGIMIPTPAGFINIPLPVVWIPLLTLSGKWGTVVVFLGICGMFPMPFVFFINNRGSKSFFATIWGASDEFGIPRGKKTMKLMDPRLGTIMQPLATIPGMPQIPKNDFDSLFEKIRKKVSDKIDNSAITTEMNAMRDEIIKIKQKIYTEGRKQNDINKDLDNKIDDAEFRRRSDLIKKSILNYIDTIDLPSYTFPDDESKSQYEGSIKGVQTMALDFLNLKLKNPFSVIDLKDKVVSNIDTAYNNIAAKEFDLNTQMNLKSADDFKKFKKYISRLSEEALRMLNDDQLLYSVSQIPQITISIATTCSDDIKGVTLDVEKTLQLAIASAIIIRVIDTLNNTTVINLLGFSTFKPANLVSIAKDILQTYLPSIPLPEEKFGQNFKKAMISNLKNMASVFDIKKKIPSVAAGSAIALGVPIPFPSSKTINLNNTKEILKGIIGKFFDNSNRLAEILNLDLYINGSFLNISTPEMQVLIKNIILPQLDSIKPFLKTFYTAFSLTNELRNFEVNNIDALSLSNVSKQIAFTKDLAIAVASSKLSLNNLIFMTNPLAIEKGMEILRKQKINFVVASAVAAFSPDSKLKDIARIALHPFMLYDDLPPWERMDINHNPLYVLFLDEFCHNGKRFHFQANAFGPYPAIIPGVPKTGTG